jgi:hypothetical protein
MNLSKKMSCSYSGRTYSSKFILLPTPIVLIADEFKIPHADAGTITILLKLATLLDYFYGSVRDKLERKTQILYTTFCFFVIVFGVIYL